MRFYILHILILLAAFHSCTPWKASLSIGEDYDAAINNAFLDFINTSLAKLDSSFFVYYEDINSEIIGVSIMRSVIKFFVIHNEDNDISASPTWYVESNGKLFFWKDPNYQIHEDLVLKLDEYNRFDSLETFGEAELIIDEKKTMHYYFFKNNLRQYKKVKTPKALGAYNPGMMKCK